MRRNNIIIIITEIFCFCSHLCVQRANLCKSSKVLCEVFRSTTWASSRSITSKQLTLCLIHNEALLESHVGRIKEEQGGRESSGKRMWTMCTVGFWGNNINEEVVVRICKLVLGVWALFLTPYILGPMWKCPPHPHFVPVIFWCSSHIDQNAFKL